MAPDEAMRRLQEVVDGCCDPSEAERVAGRLGLTIGLGRSQARGIRLRAGRAERIPESRRGSRRSRARRARVRRRAPAPPSDARPDRARGRDDAEGAPSGRSRSRSAGRSCWRNGPSWGSGVANAVTLRSRSAPGRRGTRAGPRGGRWPRRRCRGRRDREPDGRQPVLHRRDDGHGPSRPAGRRRQLGTGAAAHRAGGGGRAPGQLASSAARSGQARVRLHLLLRPG